MSHVEMVWIQQCEVCGCEHRHMACRVADPDGSHEDATGAFRERCESWYRAHVDATLAYQSLGNLPS